MIKTFREIIKNLGKDEVWEDIENDGNLNICIESNELCIRFKSKKFALKGLDIDIDKAMFRKVK